MTAFAGALPGLNVGSGPLKGIISAVGNYLTAVGCSIITNRILAVQGGTDPKYIGWGSGSTGSGTSTALTTETAPTSTARTAGTESRTTTTVANDTFTLIGTVTANGSTAGPIAEAGIFDASTSGNMLIYSSFGSIAVNSGDSISFTFGLTFVHS